MKRPKTPKTSVNRPIAYTGESIEDKIRRITNNREPISDGAPQIYTERKDGVQPEYDIRTDRFDVAIEAMDKIAKSHITKRDERHKPKNTEKKDDAESNPKDSKMDNPSSTTGEGSGDKK